MDDEMNRTLEDADLYCTFFGEDRDRRKSVEIVSALAAEVRALRKDRERLDWLEMEMAIEFEDGKYRALFRQNMPITREAIDAALSARGGEDGA